MCHLSLGWASGESPPGHDPCSQASGMAEMILAESPAIVRVNRWWQLGWGLACMMAISSSQYVWTLFTTPLPAHPSLNWCNSYRAKLGAGGRCEKYLRTLPHLRTFWWDRHRHHLCGGGGAHGSLVPGSARVSLWNRCCRL